MYVRKEQHAGSTFSFEQTLALSSEILSYIMENKVVYYYQSSIKLPHAFCIPLLKISIFKRHN